MEKNNLVLFMKRNAFYFVLGFCVFAIGLSLILVFTLGSSEVKLPTSNNVVEDLPADVPSDTPSVIEPVTTPTKIEFVLPVRNAEIIKDYTETMVFNNTLGRYEKHLAIDFMAEDGADVYAAYDGVVESVTTSNTKGVTIVVNHGEGLKTIYNSLADGNSVWEGKSVMQGDVIGSISTTNKQEYKDGAHLHFEVSLNGELIDPETYLMLDQNK